MELVELVEFLQIVNMSTSSSRSAWHSEKRKIRNMFADNDDRIAKIEKEISDRQDRRTGNFQSN